jgi:hypothetical protein
MAAKGGILGDVVDDDGLVALPDLVADGGFDFKFPAGHQAEFDFGRARHSKPNAAR